MPQGLVESAAQSAGRTLSGISGVAVGQVIENRDATGLARVQLRLPWLPGVQPWARVAVPMAGPGASALPGQLPTRWKAGIRSKPYR